MRLDRATKRTARRAMVESQDDTPMRDHAPCVICGTAGCAPTAFELDLIDNEIRAGVEPDEAIERVRAVQMRPQRDPLVA